ncbi:MAG TPA: glycosyltransferase [Vicinamibacterales bacterium]
MTRRICVVTAGHLATCPRMLKAADALLAEGYQVRVISTRTTGWATAADAEIAASRGWRWRVVNYDRAEAPTIWFRSGARHKAARALASMVTSLPRTVVTAAFGRVHRELVDAILEEPADLIYGGTTGAIAAVAEAGHRAGTPFAVDFEDFHCAEHESPEGDLSNELARMVMRFASDGAALVTAGSEGIARACRDELGIPATAINNVFSLPSMPPSEVRSNARGEFAAYWFSQTIGPGRGLEDVVRALGLTARPASLTLRGCPKAGYAESLLALAAREAPRVRVAIEPPLPPASMIDACRGFDLGISAEQGHIRNRLLNLPNKATTYPLAGLPVALTATAGQAPLASDLGPGALVFAPGDAAALAERMLPLMTDATRLAEARAASWHAARTRWHWEHELERGALLAAVAHIVS